MHRLICLRDAIFRLSGRKLNLSNRSAGNGICCASNRELCILT